MIIKQFSAIFISFAAAMCLSILPLPDWAAWLHPAWVALVLCFWVIYIPHYISVGIAWIIGLFLDVLSGTVLGEHALALTIVAYLIIGTRRQIRHYPFWQQAISIFVAMLVYHAVIFLLQWAIGQTILDWRFWLGPIVGMIVWPWFYFLLFNYYKSWWKIG